MVGCTIHFKNPEFKFRLPNISFSPLHFVQLNKWWIILWIDGRRAFSTVVIIDRAQFTKTSRREYYLPESIKGNRFQVDGGIHCLALVRSTQECEWKYCGLLQFLQQLVVLLPITYTITKILRIMLFWFRKQVSLKKGPNSWYYVKRFCDEAIVLSF